MKSLKVNIRFLSLLLLSIQTTVLVLLLRYSRINQEETYVISTAVFLSEILKIFFSYLLLVIENGGLKETCHINVLNDLSDVREACKLIIPAALYVVQNNLLYLALTYLDAATYQITYQLKILTTAVFSWLLLGKFLQKLQWVSLIFLMTGVVLVQIEDVSDVMKNKINLTIGDLNDYVDSNEKPSQGLHNKASWFIGILCVLFSCISSGFSGVYFEKLLKHGKTTSLGVRNLHMGFFSIIFCIMSMLPHWETISSRGFLYGYFTPEWIVILLQSVGGLIVSITMKYADNILKGFATSISIVTSSIASYLLLGDRPPSVQFATGAFIVISATFLYGVCDQGADQKKPSPYKKE